MKTLVTICNLRRRKDRHAQTLRRRIKSLAHTNICETGIAQPPMAYSLLTSV